MQEYLLKHDYQVKVVEDGVTAASEIISTQPDMVILDIMLPGISGTEVCKQVRPKYSGPIVMLTALDEDIDQMLGLELGADDYIVKPVVPRLLLSRIRAVSRRFNYLDKPQQNNESEDAIQVGVLEVNLAHLRASIDGRDLQTSTSEFDLLTLLARNAGKVVSRDTIIRELRGFEYDGHDRSIDRRVSRLRKKLERAGSQVMIKSVRTKGYQLCVKTTPV